MKRAITSHVKATATLALACAATLVFAVTTVQARPAHTAGSQAATAPALSPCTIVVTGAPWRNREAGRTMAAGNKYTVGAGGMSCSSAGALVVALTHRHGTAYGQAFKGPQGFTCKSLTLPALGALQVAGRCMRPPQIFIWGPQLPGH